MTASLILFYVYAAVAVIGAIGMVSSPKLVHAVMWLFATLFAIAALYLSLGSEFLAAMQLFVYGGAVTVLVLFVLMLARPTETATSKPRATRTIAAAVLCAAFFAALAATLGGASFSHDVAGAHDTAQLAQILFSRYALPFELAGLALTIALIGAIVLAREEDAE